MRNVLITTYGLHEEKVFEAMKHIKYHSLYIITGGAGANSTGLEKIIEIENIHRRKVEVITLDVFDFRVCYNNICNLIERLNPGTGSVHKIIINASGGTKLLGMAAIFAAFRYGIEVYNCEEGQHTLPVIRGFIIDVE